MDNRNIFYVCSFDKNNKEYLDSVKFNVIGIENFYNFPLFNDFLKDCFNIYQIKNIIKNSFESFDENDFIDLNNNIFFSIKKVNENFEFIFDEYHNDINQNYDLHPYLLFEKGW
jgi:hypothetical protein